MIDSDGLKFREWVPLSNRTSFRVGGSARYFVEVGSLEELSQALGFASARNLETFILGAGSNIVVSDDGFPGVVIALMFRGIHVVEEDEESVLVNVAAGENWDAFVLHAVSHGWWGIENMSLIPGTVGAVPIQNVGAYGQEAAQVIQEVEVFDRETSQIVRLDAESCQFGYRRSLFNREARGRYIVLFVLFRLWKQGEPELGHDAVRNLLDPSPRNRLDSIKRRLRSRFGSPVSLQARDLRDAVVSLRTDGRLPDPEQFGNAGSFFQSPVVKDPQWKQFQNRAFKEFCQQDVEELFYRSFRVEGGFKVPAASLIRLAGVASAVEGGAALYQPNPTVMINQNGTARAAQLLALSRKVRVAVYEQLGLVLPVEPEFIGFDPEQLASYFVMDS